MTVETQRPNEQEAAQLEAAAGVVIAEIKEGQPPEVIGTGTDFQECCHHASELSAVNRSRVFGVFTLNRSYHKETSCTAIPSDSPSPSV